MISEQPAGEPLRPTRWRVIVRNTAYILLALFIFLIALDLMISSLQHLGASAVQTIITATSNPFTALFIGLLVTAIIQSSSATTSMVVALVASGAINLESAIPLIMGANVGTTITSTIVSLGFITKRKEFRRAVSAGTYHDFFNILTVLILFPLEYYYHFLSGLSQWVAGEFFNQPIGTTTRISLLGGGLTPMVDKLVSLIDNGFVLIILSIALLFGSILFFRKVLSNILGLGTQGRVQSFFFRSPLGSFGWGLVTTAAIRSSTVTTSLVVPLVAKKVIKLSEAVPFILGANIGTTITAFIAAMTNSNVAISIAIAHFLFNLIGVLIFTLIPYVKSIPVNLAKGLGRLTIKYRLVGFVYILLTFFFIPFSLIYLNRDAFHEREMLYKRNDGSEFKIVAKTFRNQNFTSWAYYLKDEKDPFEIVEVERRKKMLIINNELFEFARAGSCRDGEDQAGSYKLCVTEIVAGHRINDSLATDSVYTFRKVYTATPDTIVWRISARDNIILSRSAIVKTARSEETLQQMLEK